MGGKKKAIPNVSREEFLLAVKDLEEALLPGGGVFSKNKEMAQRAEAALRTVGNYTRAKAAEVRAKRKSFRVLEGGKEV